jgi:monoamine oxidase
MRRAGQYPALTRRSVLGGLAGSAAGLVAGSGSAATHEVDFVIVGAGAAGIGAALTLAKANKSFVILEAANHGGGRAFTDSKTFGVPFDVGCAWIHAHDLADNSMAKVVQDWQREHAWSSDTYDKGVWDTHDFDELHFTDVFYGCAAEARLSKEDLEKLEPAEEDVAKAIKQAASDIAADRTVHNWRPFADVAATSMGPMDAAVDLHSLSTFESRATAEYSHNVLIKNGYGTVIRLLAEGLPQNSLRTNARVTDIITRRSGAKVVVKNAGVISAKAVIVTVSTGVLAEEAIRFTPSLEADQQEAIHNLPMGLLVKIPLWVPGIGQELKDNKIKSFGNVLDQRPDQSSIYFLACPFDTDLVVGFLGGDFAWEFARRVPKVRQGSAPPETAVKKVTDEVAAFAQERLADLSGCGGAIKATKYMFTDWGWNPLTYGGYSAAKPGHYAAREKLRKPAHERIFFAGEAVAEGGWHATCHGAFDSGVKTAEAVVATFRH